MTNQDKQRKIYIRNTKQWVPVNEEVYLEYYRPVWRLQKETQKNGQCMCPKSKLWLCDGDCVMCEYHAAGNTISLDVPIENGDGDDFSLVDTLADPNAVFADIIVDRLLLERLIDELTERYPDGKRICALIMDGQSEREAAETLNMARSTFKRRWTAIKNELRQRLNKQ